MKLISAHRVSPHYRLVAINPAFYEPAPGRAHIEALWLDRKHGLPVVKAGMLQIDWDTWMWNHRLDQRKDIFTLEELLSLDRLDIYHRTEHIWNGITLWSKASPPRVELEGHLRGFYDTLQNPTVPEGWEGWFCLSYENRYNP